MTASRRRVTRVLAAGLVGLVAMVALAAPASAHATVESSSPADGDRLTSAPSQVSIVFSEPVTTDLGGLRVVNATGERVDSGNVTGSGTSTLSVGVRSGVGDGTYVATYRVVSADSHPVKGSLVFTVGTGQTADVSSILSGGNVQDKGFEVLGWASRFLAYLGALGAAGLAFFLFFIHDGGPEAPMLARITRIGALVAVVGALGTAAAQAGLATGRGWSGVFDLGVLHTVLTQNLDWATVVLLAGLAVILGSLEVRGQTAQRALAFYGALATVLAFVLTGHPTEAANRWLAVLSDAVHAAAAAAWLGGLIGLATVLVVRGRRHGPAATPQEPGPTAPSGPSPVEQPGSGGTTVTVTARPAIDAATLRSTVGVVSRFSTMALITVVALWVAGAALAWIELGSLSAFGSTTYGRLVLTKIGIVLAVAVLAAYNRFRLIPDLLDDVDGATADQTGTETGVDATTDSSRSAASDAAWRGLSRLRRTVVLEALALVVVLGVTSALVNTPPGKAAATQNAVFDQSQPITTGTAGTTVNLVVSPAKGGQKAIHISYFGADRRPFEVAGPVQVELTLAADQIGPIKRDAPRAGPGHFLIDGIQISPAGAWQITVVTRLSDFDEQRTTFDVPIS